jgi:hypothetical protein
MEFPPNPNQNLDRTLKTTPASANQSAGAQAYQQDVGGGLSCVACHSLPSGSNRMVISAQTLQEPQQQKVPQLRNMYRKNGLVFGSQPVKSGFGFTHDGALDTLAGFLAQPVFNPWPAATKDDIVEFLLAFDTGTAPTVGYQVTVTAANANASTTLADFALLESQATLGNCNLVAKGRWNGTAHGLVFNTSTSRYTGDASGMGPWTSADLRAQAASGAATWTLIGVPPGSAQRIGVDRDSDGVLDGAEGVTNLGGANAGCLGVPEIAANGEPRIGNSLFAVVANGLPPNTSGVFAVRGTRVAPSPVTPFVYGGLVLSDGHGFAHSHQPLPSDPQLVGDTFQVQFRFPDPCTPHGRVKTDVLAITIQP